MLNQAIQAQRELFELYLGTLERFQQQQIQMMRDALEFADQQLRHRTEFWRSALGTSRAEAGGSAVIATPETEQPSAVSTQGDSSWNGPERRKAVLLPHAGAERRSAMLKAAPQTQH